MKFVENYSSLPWTPVNSRAFPEVPMNSCAFDMHLNRLLLDIIRQPRAILWFCYGIESAFVVDWPIPCALNGLHQNLTEICLYCEYAMYKSTCLYWAFVIASNQPYSDVRYRYESAYERPIIYIVSLRIGTWMPYYFYHKSPIWNLNDIFYWKLSQLLLGVLLLRKWIIRCE